MELEKEVNINFKNKKTELSVFTRILMFFLGNAYEKIVVDANDSVNNSANTNNTTTNNTTTNNTTTKETKLTEDELIIKRQEKLEENFKKKEISDKINRFLESDMPMWVVEAQINGYILEVEQAKKFNMLLFKCLARNDTQLLDKMIENNVPINNRTIIKWLSSSVHWSSASHDTNFAKLYVKEKMPELFMDKKFKEDLYLSFMFAIGKYENIFSELNHNKKYNVNSKIKEALQQILELYCKQVIMVINDYKEELDDVLKLDRYMELYQVMKKTDAVIEKCTYIGDRKYNAPTNMESYKFLLDSIRNKLENDFVEEKAIFLHDIKTLNIHSVVENKAKILTIQSAKKEVLPQLSKESLEILSNIDKLIHMCLKDNQSIPKDKQLLIENLYENRVPEIVNKYISIDVEYREKLMNIDKKKPEQLMNESLKDIEEILASTLEEINQLRVDSLSATQRYTNTVKKTMS